MSYLSRLKQLADGEKFTHSADTELTKPPKAPSVSSVSTTQGRIETIPAANDPATDSTGRADVRMGQVIARLHGDPGLRYAAEFHTDADPAAVILTLAIRDKAACELRIPREKYDPFLLLDLIERHSGTVQ